MYKRQGMTCAHNYEVVTKKAALESSLQKILVADSSKFGQVKPGYFAELEEIDEIVTDDGLSQEWQELIAEKEDVYKRQTHARAVPARSTNSATEELNNRRNTRAGVISSEHRPL